MMNMTYGKREQQNMNQSSATCAACQKQKYQLKPKKSRLMKGQTFLVCNSCFENGYEPRWLVIVVGQDQGKEAVRDYLLNKKYSGPEITAAELLK